MKVLQFSTWKEPCGIAGYTANLVEALAPLGIDSEVYPVDAQHRKYWTRSELRRNLDRFSERAREADLVHIQHEFSFFDPRSLHGSVARFRRVLAQLRRQRRPVVVTFHTHPPFRRGLVDLVAERHPGLGAAGRLALLTRNAALARYWRHRVARHFQGRSRMQAVVHTKTTRLALVDEGHFAADRVSVLPMGVAARSADLRSLDRDEAKRRLGFKPDTTLVSIFGFVQAFKGYEVALKALATLPPHWHLAVVGGPHPEGRSDRTLDGILRLQSSRRLKGRVTVTGFAEVELLDLYHAATDICLAPYRRGELISGSVGITWALSSGRPVVASDIPVFRELREDGDCLLLFAEDAHHDLAWQMQRLAADHCLQDRLVSQADRYVAERTWPHVAQAMLDIYNRTAGHGR